MADRVRPSFGFALFFALVATVHCQSNHVTPPLNWREGCPSLEGTPWLPQEGSLSDAHHDPTVEILRSEMIVEAPYIGMGDSLKEVLVEIPMPIDLGPNGSLMLIAEGLGIPRGLKGGAYPLLTSLQDGAHDLIHLDSRGSIDRDPLLELSCPHPEGLYCCFGGSCKANPKWNISYPSAYSDRDQWEQHQINPFGYLSVSTFPTCHWTRGSPTCLFNDQNFFSTPHLRFGESYRAKYTLLLDKYDSYSEVMNSLSVPRTGQFKLTVLRKKTSKESTVGALDLNIILVGARNVAASRTEKGQQNLNALLTHIQKRFDPGGQGLKIGKVQVFEWDCRNGGDPYAEISIENLGNLFSVGTSLLPKESETKALNLFLVSNILGARPGVTILGASGGVGGPLIFGTSASGLVFGSFNKLDQFDFQESQFIEMAETMAHEIGHFLGLNHLSESNGKRHDGLPDTPKCTKTELRRTGVYITHQSCRQVDSDDIFPLTSRNCSDSCPTYDGKFEFCPTSVECPFNHLMWWTTKNFNAGKGDGSLISEDSWKVIRFSPAVQ